MQILEAALKYAASGKSVIPVGRDKKPLIAWKEFQSRRATEEEVKAWWKQWPDANVGLVTGRISNMIVVDVEKGGDISIFPTTCKIKTGGGGYHLYYKYMAGFENQVRTYALTDLRADGGYVVAAPSIHASGEKYEIIENRNFAEFPAHLFGKKYEVKDWKSIVSGVGEGNRNDTAAKVCGKLCAALHPNDWEALVWPMLMNWNQSNTPPMSEYELRQVFNSIAKREAGKERTAKEEDVEFIPFTKVVEEGMAELDATTKKDIISFGYKWLDDQVTGIFKGELVVIGGETGTGKTTWATNVIYKASAGGHKCAVFALEDRLQDYGIKATWFELGKIRTAEGLSNYPWNDYRRNDIRDLEYPTYKKKAMVSLRNDDVVFARVPKQMNIDLLEKLVEQKTQEGYGLFLIDHLHHFDLNKGKDSKADYIEQVMVRMVNLCKRTGARILLVVHYRKLNGQKPSLDSFKDAQAIPQNANYVINIWRDRKLGAENRFNTTFAVSKARNPNGEASVDVKFNPTTGDYESYFGSEWESGTSEESSQEKIKINY